MRNVHKYLLILLFFTIASGCEKDLPTFLEFENYKFASIDQTGGNWKPVLLKKGSDLRIEMPKSTNSDEYKQELEKLKSDMLNMTPEDKKAVVYWSQNPIIRWNEIALELIAKYNLIPGPNADGTYTLPNPENPSGTPVFPFANPPYACRALAYLSVAQFDGLISAWHYKYQYARAAPYKNDVNLPFAYTATDTPSYPSDGAVIATVSKKILTQMFPLELAYLEKKEAEHLKSLRLSGGNVQSDVDAGVSIGQQISEVAIARAKSDGMKNAQASRAIADSLSATAKSRFGWQWENLEVPTRPVGLVPLFGKVKMWSVENVADTRPAPPPALDSPELIADIKVLQDYAKNMTPERRRIANYWQDGLNTYTPPGHWNEFAKVFVVKYRQNPLQSARTFAYLNMAMMDAAISCWDTKYYYNYPRPIQLINKFKTIAGTPNFPSYTSGHSVFSSAGAEVLAYVFPAEANIVREWAKEAAISRVYGGIHWTFDATVGTEQGKKVAQYTINTARKDGGQ